MAVKPLKNKKTTPPVNSGSGKRVPPSPPFGGWGQKGNQTLIWVYASGIVLLTFMVLYPLVNSDFLNWDDPIYVLQNPNIYALSAANIWKMFSSYAPVGQYCPLSQLSWAIDFWLAGGLHPLIFHLTSLLFHLANTLMLFLFVLRLDKAANSHQLIANSLKGTASSSSIIAAVVASILFGIHPMRLESVAWVTERRDVLYAFFFILGMLTYLTYINKVRFEESDRGAKGSGARRFYIFTILCCLASLFSKGMAVTFPLALIVIDYITYRKFDRKVILEKVPFFCLSAIFSIEVILVERAIGSMDVVHLPLYYHLFSGNYALLLYLVKAFVPFHLSVHHPYPYSLHESSPIAFYVSPLILLAIAVFVFIKWRKDRYLIGSLFFFLLTIFPLLQFLSSGETLISERYTYIPYIGLFLFAGHIAAFTGKYFPAGIKNMVFWLVPVWLIALCVITRSREKVWHDPVSFWTDAIDQYPNNKYAYNNRGCMYLEFQEYDKALSDFNKGIEVDTTFGRLYADRGNCDAHFKDYDLALKDYARGMRLDTLLWQPYFARAGIEADVYQQYDKALSDYKIALRKAPGNIDVFYQMGLVYYKMNDGNNTVTQCNKYLKISPDAGKAIYLRALGEALEKEYSAAVADAQRAKQLGITTDDNVLQQWKALVK